MHSFTYGLTYTTLMYEYRPYTYIYTLTYIYNTFTFTLTHTNINTYIHVTLHILDGMVVSQYLAMFMTFISCDVGNT